MVRTVPPQEEPKSERLNMRASAQQKALLAQAAEAVQASLSEFVLEVATERAEEILAAQDRTVLTRQAYEAFVEALDAPPADKPALAELLGRPRRLPEE